MDEIVVVSLGVILARKMIPGEVLAERRGRAWKAMREDKKPVSRAAAVFMVAVRVLLATLGGVFAFRIAQGVGT